MRRRQAAALLYEGAGVVLAMPLWLWWALWRGGYPPTVWIPGLVYLALVVLLLVATRPPARPRGAAAVALGALAALTAWSGLSILWAADQGSAWLGAERALLLLLGFAIPLIWPPPRSVLAIAVLVLPAVSVAGGLAGIAGALVRPASLTDGRLVGPAGYPNASAALFLMAAVSAIVTAGRPERRAATRVAMIAAAAVLVDFALLTQSRGVVAAGAVTVVVALLLGPGRLRTAVAVALVAGGAVAASHWLLAVRVGVQAGRGRAELESALVAIGAFALVAAACGAVVVALDRRAVVGPRGRRAATLGARAAVAAALVFGIAAFVATQGDPIAWARGRWLDFKTPHYIQLEAQRSRFGGNLGSNRYDYWRVAVDLAGARPVSGVGVENFASPYLERRRSAKGPTYAHSIWFGKLAELGVTGLALMIAFVAALVVALRRVWRVASVAHRALVASAVLPGVYLLVHGVADWLDVFPALVVPALGLAAAAAASAPSADPRGGARTARTRPVTAVVCGLVLVLSFAALPVFLSSALVERAASTAAQRPAAALRDLALAADVDPLNAAAPLQRGIVALADGRPDEARRSFAKAARRDGSNWFAHFGLAALAARAGDRQRAASELARARRLNPRDRVLAGAAPLIAAGTPVDPRAVTLAALREGG